MRPRPPAPVVQQEVSPAKGGKDKGKPAVAQPEPEQDETTEDGGRWFKLQKQQHFFFN
jgi:hypothetical protein